MAKQKWKKLNQENEPQIEWFIAAIRISYPSAYWMGYYTKGMLLMEEPFEYYIRLEDPLPYIQEFADMELNAVK